MTYILAQNLKKCNIYFYWCLDIIYSIKGDYMIKADFDVDVNESDSVDSEEDSTESEDS